MKNINSLQAGFSSLIALFVLMSGCAIQSPQIESKESPASSGVQKRAQEAVLAQQPSAPLLKRKIALGRITNETMHGRSLLRDRQDDPLGKQVTDLMSKALTETGAYLVFERPDLGRVIAEGKLTGAKLDLIGVDSLIVGSLTEFGRKTVGESGFASASKKQIAFAKIDIRVVDATTGHVFFATSGAGEASTESASTFGFGSRAGYDGTLNDAAIRQAVSDAISRMSVEMSSRPWQTSILKVEGVRVFVSGGKNQGLKPGLVLSVLTMGDTIRSPQTGANITLPGRQIAQLRVESNFGDSDLNEGSVATLVSGAIASYKPEQLVIRFDGVKQ